MKENSVLFAVICRKDQKASESLYERGPKRLIQINLWVRIDNNSQKTDIGILHLKSPPAWLAHTRTLELNIGFAETQDGKDNFVEAIDWARKWAFDNNLVDRLEWKIPGWNCDLSIGAIYHGFELEFKKQGALVKHGVKYDEYCLVHKRVEK